MKKVIIMVSLCLFPRLLVAQEMDLKALEGEYWYGLYLAGQKVGYSQNALTVDDSGGVTISEDARFQMSMVGIKQDMRIVMKRHYAPDGELASFEQVVDDIGGKKIFRGRIEGGNLVLATTVGGASKKQVLPKPKESLQDALKQVHLVSEGAKIGDELGFSIFEPLYQREISGTSRITDIGERVLDGVPTKVFEVRTKIDIMGIETVSHIAEDGTTLEDVVGGIITMRLEPEAVAKDSSYVNDVIVSNAARVNHPIPEPRTRERLELELKGPLTDKQLFSDDRQQVEITEGGFHFAAERISREELKPVELPITDEAVKQWLEPTLFVQSDDPRLVEKARDIIGKELNSFDVSRLLCSWVYENVQATFSARLTNALEVLDQLEGDCTEHSILFVGLARAAGLPAREVAGLVYTEGAAPGFYFHQWAKVWVGQWIDVDPTFNQPLVDVTHIKLAEGDLLAQAALIPVIGRVSVEVVDGEEQAP